MSVEEDTRAVNQEACCLCGMLLGIRRMYLNPLDLSLYITQKHGIQKQDTLWKLGGWDIPPPPPKKKQGLCFKGYSC